MNVVGFLRCACPLDRFEVLEVAHTRCDILGDLNSNDIYWGVRQGNSSNFVRVKERGSEKKMKRERERGSEKKMKRERERCGGASDIKGNILTS